MFPRTPQSQLSCLAPGRHISTLTEQAWVSWRSSQSLISGLYIDVILSIESLPFFRSPEEAGAYVRTLQAVLRAVGSSDGNMEQVCKSKHANVIKMKGLQRSLGFPPMRR